MTSAAPTPKVGVVIPVRDGAAHLGGALRSVLAQEPAPHDVVVVDGGSTDGSAELARSWPGVRVVAQTGAGLGQARNQGVAEVRGELVAFCDADDRWTEGSLAVRVQALVDDPELAAVVGTLETVALDGTVVPSHRQADLGRRTVAWTPGGVVLRRATLDQVGAWREDLHIGTDSDWLVRLAASGLAIHHLDHLVLVKGARSQSLSTDVAAYRDELLQVGWSFVRRRRGRTTPAAHQGGRSVLHVLARLQGGGPERGVIAQAGQARAAGRDERHTAVALEGPGSLSLLVAARRAGLDVVVSPEPDELDRLVEQHDLLVVHWWNHPVLRALLERPLPPARLVLWCHVLGLHPPQVLTADLAEVADQVVLTSEARRASERARAATDAGTPVVVLPAPVDLSRLDGLEPRPHDGVRIGYVGLVNDTKLVASFASLCAAVADPTTSFVVAGGGGGEAQLRERFAQVGLAERAQVLGPTDDVRGVLEQLDVFVSPLVPDTYASSEGTLQEAMWAGLPVVVFRGRGGAWPAVEHERTGLLVDDEAGLVAALDRLVADPDLRTRLGRAARAHAVQAFAPEPRRAAIDALLAEVADRPRRARTTLAGVGEAAARRFVRSLGDQGGPFVVSLGGAAAGHDPAAVAEADVAIAGASVLLAQGDGGIAHWRNAHPDDAHLRWWSGLVAEAGGRLDVALAEYEAAEALGLGDARPGVRRRAILEGEEAR